MLSYDKLVDGIFLVKSDDKNPWKCQGVLIQNPETGNVLIDCNFKKSEYKQLFSDFGDRIDVYIATHAHLDHANNLQYFEKLKPEVEKLCPIPENEYLMNIDLFIRDNGALDFGIGESLKAVLLGIVRFKELKSVTGFPTGKEFNFEKIKIKTIPTTGHSPGHFAMIIENPSRKILFASDIGLDNFGPWYGFKYNSLKEIRSDVKKIEEIYLNGDYILASSHGEIFFDKQPDIFKEVLSKVDRNEKRLLKLFENNPNTPKGLRDLTLKGVIYSPKTIAKWSTLGDNMDNLIHFWEGYFVLNHISELVERGILREVEDEKWILNQ